MCRTVCRTIHRVIPTQSSILLEEGIEKSYRMFCSLIDSGVPGLLISRNHPEKLARKYRIPKIPVVWLSRSKAEYALSPCDFLGLKNAVEGFLERNQKSVIMLDGIEYFTVQIGFDRTCEYLKEFKKIVVSNDSLLIVPFCRSTIDEDELDLLSTIISLH